LDTKKTEKEKKETGRPETLKLISDKIKARYFMNNGLFTCYCWF